MLQEFHLHDLPANFPTLGDLIEQAPNLNRVCLQYATFRDATDLQGFVDMLVQHCPLIGKLELIGYGLPQDPLHNLHKMGSLKYLHIDLSLLADLEDEQNLLFRPHGQVPAQLEAIHIRSIDYADLKRRLLQYDFVTDKDLRNHIVNLASALKVSYVSWTIHEADEVPRDVEHIKMSDMLMDVAKIWKEEAKSRFEIFADGCGDQLVECSKWYSGTDATEGFDGLVRGVQALKIFLSLLVA